jgi:cytidylate kinase
MPCRVVCISSTDAASGEAVGRDVAGRLGFRYVDEQIVARAAELAQVDPGLVAAAEKRQPLLQRIIDKLAVAEGMIAPVALGTLLPVGGLLTETLPIKADRDDLRTLIRASIHEVAKQGQAVIVAHAASMALASHDGVFRVLVTASVDTRVRRLVASGGTSEAEAAAAVARSDRNRQDYLSRFYEVRQELPTHYDLVVNTDVLGPEQAADIVAFAARAA